MSRLYKPALVVAVQTDVRGAPCEVQWRGEIYQGQVLDHWRIQTGWWDQEIVRDFYLWDSEDLICVLYHDQVHGEWRLHRVYD